MKNIVIELRVKEVAEENGIDNPFSLSKQSGLAYANCYKIWHGQQTMIGLDTLDRLCDALGCEPGDILIKVPKDGHEAKTGQSGDPLAAPRRSGSIVIEMRIEQLLEERGRTFYWLAKETGIGYTSLGRLRHEGAKGLSFDFLERICRALECQPGDLLVLRDNKAKSGRSRKRR